MELVLATVSDRSFAALLALILSLAIGIPRILRPLRPLNPSRFLVNLLRRLEHKLNRKQRGVQARRVRGLVIVLFFMVLAIATGWLLSLLARSFDHGVFLEIFLLVMLLPLRPLYEHHRRVRKLLQRKSLEKARRAVKPFARRNVSHLDPHAVARATIESLAENFVDALLSPLCWYLIGGLPALFVCRLVTVMDQLYGHRSPRYASFGWGAAWVDQVLHWLPTRLGGVILAIASIFAPSGRPLQALKVMWQSAGKFISPNSGWPIASMAGALNVTLGGPRGQLAIVVDDPWVGSGSAKTTVRDMRRAEVTYLIAGLLTMLMLAVLSQLR